MVKKNQKNWRGVWKIRCEFRPLYKEISLFCGEVIGKDYANLRRRGEEILSNF